MTLAVEGHMQPWIWPISHAIFLNTDLEQILRLLHTGRATHLSDRVHTELRAAQVHSGHAQLGTHDWANGAATGGVVSHHKVLLMK